jgi:hypothetical protein
MERNGYRSQAHRDRPEPETMGELWDDMRAHPGRTIAEVATLLFVLLVLLGSFTAAGLIGWGAAQ